MLKPSHSPETGTPFMQRLSIRHVLVAVAIVPLLMALVLSGILVSERQKMAQDVSAIKHMGTPLILLSELVHELQKERGETAVFMAEGDKGFAAKLQAQRAKTDQKQAALDRFLASNDYTGADAQWLARLADITAGLGERATIRERVDQQHISAAAALEYYTGTNLQVLELIKYTARLSDDVPVANVITGFAYFLMGKERAGIERAVGSSGFAKGQFSTVELQKLQNLIAIQDIYFKEFEDLAPEDLVAMLQDILQSPAAKDVQTMRDTALAGAAGTFSGAGFAMATSVSSYSAADFFAAQTQKIDLLKGLENRMSARLQDMLAQKQAQAVKERNLLIAAMAGLLCLIAGFAMALIRAVSASVVAVVTTAERMAQGDLETAFPPVTKNEIGRIAAALLKFRDSILEGRRQEALAKQKEKELRAAQARQEQEAREAEKAREAEARLREQERLEERALHEQETREAEKALEEAHRRQQEELREKEQQAAAEIAAVVRAYGEGDFSKEMDTADKDGVFAEICEGMNRIGRLTRQNLEQVQAALSALKSGDIRHRMTGQFSGAFLRIQQDLNEAFESLTSVINQIDSSSEKVRASTHEIAEASTSLARRTEAAAANLEETTSSVEELSTAVHRTSELAITTNSSIAEIERQAKASTEIVKETIEAITGIKEASKTISKTITVIDEIAFQTNLLALNAGVEAARAGDAGRGFAVVAAEIRDLAAKSSDAAHEISALMKNNEAQVADGVTLVDQTGAALMQIDTDISAISRSVNEIAEFATQQSGSIDEIKLATKQLDKVTQENAAMFEETTALNVSLKTETELLRNIMANFDLGQPAPAANEERVVPLPAKPAPRRAASAALKPETQQDWQDF